MEWVLHRILCHSLVLFMSLCSCQTFAVSQSVDSPKISKLSKMLDELRLLRKEREIYGPENTPDFWRSQSDSDTLDNTYGFLKNVNNDKGRVGNYFMADSNDALLHDMDVSGLDQNEIERRLNAWRMESGTNSKSKRNWNIELKSDEKRQGSWDFDYGLGGGRFGKRGLQYRDYPLGGGRFGRDVDHIDIDIEN